MAPRAAELELGSRSIGDVVVVTARGLLDVSTAGRLRDHLLKVGADQPAAVVVDLAGLGVPVPTVTTMFATVHAKLAEWPGVPMVLVAAADGPAELLAWLRLNRFVPVRRNVADAVAAAGEPPERLVERLLLPNSPASVDIARRFVRDSCVLWGHAELVDDAAALLGELVTNTVTHTGSMARLRVELRRDLLSVAVYDDDPSPPLPRDGERGLALIGSTATAWGWSPTLGGGKVVWATLRVRRQRPEENRVSRGERP